MVTFNENHRMSSCVIKVVFLMVVMVVCFFVFVLQWTRRAPAKLTADGALEMLWENHCKELYNLSRL